jgi:hypothetical protein
MKFIYIYSKLQIYFIKNFKCVNNIKINNYLTNFKQNEKKTFCNFEIYSSSSNNNFIDKQIIYNKNNLETIPERSNITFISLVICIDENKTYKVNLKTDNYNFYLIGNKFTKDFFVYYLINYLNISEKIFKEKNISIELIDHNANFIKINFIKGNENIILDKNNYTINN